MMFDTMYYAVITVLIATISLSIFIGLMINILFKHKKITLINCIVFILTLVGMYLYIPFKFMTIGFEKEQPEKLETAIKLSINPYEKRLCWNILAQIYANDQFNQGIKDGNKAIECMEKAIQGEYKKYPIDTSLLGIWYSTKNDREKVFELNKEVKNTTALRNIYILNDEYRNALKTFEDSKGSIRFYLKADLHRKLGEFEAAQKAKEIADKESKARLRAYDSDEKKASYLKSIEKFKTVDGYKKWLQQKRIEDKFN